jgi:hypothetical protein
MKKMLWLLGLLVFLVSGCNLPARDPLPSSDLIETIVVQTLDAIPTATPEPIQTQPEIELTEMVVLTIEPTATQTFTPTPGDLLANLGNPILKDTLDRGNGFGISAGGYSDEAAEITVANGAMNMSSRSTTGWRTWRVRPPETADAYLEGIYQTNNCSGSDQYGLVLRAPNYESGHGVYFGLTCDGRYSLLRWDNSGLSTIVSAASSQFIESGPGKTNRLGILAKGSNFKLFANGQMLQEVSDAALEKGFFGAYIIGNSGILNVSLHEITCWPAP